MALRAGFACLALVCFAFVSLAFAGHVPAIETTGDLAGLDLYDLGLDDKPSTQVFETQPLPTDVPLALAPAEVIRFTAKYSPAIRSAYERKVTEEARYRFFIVSREAFSYGTALDYAYWRTHDNDTSDIDRNLVPNVFVRKEFYDTTATWLRVGYDLASSSDDHSGNAVVRAGVTVPLFASREALGRSNEKIYAQNKVNDASLEYYREVRGQIHESLEAFSQAMRAQEALRYQDDYIKDLKSILSVAESLKGRDITSDRGKIEATLATADAQRASNVQEFEVVKERLKTNMGIPFEAPLVIREEEFAPFGDESREQLEKVALQTDAEIKTLLNAVRSAQAELQLARKGKWDTSLFVEGGQEFFGNGDDQGDTSYGVTTGVSVTRIDNRILRTLEEIALASIRTYRNDLISRRRQIHANTTDAYSTLQSQTKEVRAREVNVPRYQKDFQDGLELYRAGTITVDELIKKRQDLYYEQSDIAWARHSAIGGTAELLTSTGRYEQYMDPADRKRDAPPDTGAANGAAIESTDATALMSGQD
jgi:outer membrane protein TolC